MKNLNQTAIVTGAGSLRGIGRRTAEALAAQGWSIAVLDIDEAAAQRTAAAIAESHKVQARGYGCDVTQAEAVSSAVGKIGQELPPIGALINNAGVTSPIRFHEVTEAEWTRVMDINVRGAFLVTRAVIGGMMERRFGRIVMLSSVSAERGGGVFGAVAYSAAKAGLLGFARALAREAGSFGITVNSVAPGLIDTDITAGKLDPERKAKLIADVPMGRSGNTDDVADVIAYLCRPETSYVTGATWDINGGSHIH
ncbi:SDR family NAD(P)-dependent oxidoreductase [Asaia sp. VD9]|uniref:SDR family NAD(P)-dependent oxidoreductase n=1 Tax=Asaia sp. VD9 TaxID=3081235 RepID=UPI00301844F1